MKKTYLFSIVIGLTFVAVFLLYLWSTQKKAQKKVFNSHAAYDIPVMTQDTLSPELQQKVEKLKNDPTNLGFQLIQVYKSGHVGALTLPAQPVASVSAMKGTIHGVEVRSEDYYSTILHLINLDDSKQTCDTLANQNMHSTMFANNPGKLPTRKAGAYVWDLVSQKGELLEQVNACYIDGSKQAWIIDFYMPKPVYLEKYRQIMPSIIDNFTYL